MRRSFAQTSLIAAVAGALVVGAGAVSAAAVTTPLTSDSTVEGDVTDPLVAAARQAVRTGEVTPVPELTSETTTVDALPDGRFSMRSTRQPVRTHDGQNWVPIDDRLERNDDGSLSPAASAVDLTFSAGGSGPLVRMGTSEGEVALTWPDPLPAPVVEGDTATYRDVLPGVDLSLIAGPEGYKQLFTVNTAAAANNPALESLKLEARADGVRLAVGPDGALAATDDSGKPVMSGPQPYQWDSSAGSEPVPTDESTAAGEVHPVQVQAAVADGTDHPATTTVTVTPNVAELRAADTVFPVRIDPSMSKNRLNYLTVQSGGLDYYNDTSEPMRVGKCYNVYGECTSGNGVARSYFQFDTSPISDQAVTATVFSAKVIVRQIHNALCSSTPVALYSAGAFTASTNYGGPLDTALQTKSSAAGNAGCGNADADIQFDAASITAHLQNTANHDYNNVYFALKSTDESNWDYWKKFGINPELVVVFDFPPGKPTNLGVSPGPACPGEGFTRSGFPSLRAQADNNNPGYSTVDLQFEVYFRTGSTKGTRTRYSPAINVPEKTIYSWPLNSSNSSNPTSPLPDGTYYLRVQSESASPDNADLGTWSDDYPFTIDTAAPANPTVTSYDYPANTWGAASNFKGTFNVAGSADAALFTYGIDSAPPAVADSTCTDDNFAGLSGSVKAAGGKAALTPGTAMAPGYHTLTVRAYDGAHNASPSTATYSFYVAPTNTDQSGTTNQHRWEAESLSLNTPAGTLPGSTPAGNLPAYNETSSTYWSGTATQQSHLLAPADLSAQPEFTYTLPTAKPGYYSLGLRYTKQDHYADFNVKVNGQTVLNAAGTPLLVSSYNNGVLVDYVDLGGHRLNGTSTITIKLVGYNPLASTYTYNGTFGSYTLQNTVARSVGIDFITAALLESQPYPSLAAAFNNDGVTDSATVANLENTSAPKSLSSTALGAAGASVGQALSFTVGGTPVTFTRPAPTTKGDNVLAMGQTITIPATTVTEDTAVHFLVAATCGSIPTATRYNATFGVDLGGEIRDHNVGLPATPDWLASSSPSLPKLALTSHYTGATVTNAANNLYVISATLTPEGEEVGLPLNYVVLPDTGATTAKTSTCQRPALHVLAMTIT